MANPTPDIVLGVALAADPNKYRAAVERLQRRAPSASSRCQRRPRGVQGDGRASRARKRPRSPPSGRKRSPSLCCSVFPAGSSCQRCIRTARGVRARRPSSSRCCQRMPSTCSARGRPASVWKSMLAENSEPRSRAVARWASPSGSPRVGSRWRRPILHHRRRTQGKADRDRHRATLNARAALNDARHCRAAARIASASGRTPLDRAIEYLGAVVVGDGSTAHARHGRSRRVPQSEKPGAARVEPGPARARRRRREPCERAAYSGLRTKLDVNRALLKTHLEAVREVGNRRSRRSETAILTAPIRAAASAAPRS